MNTEYIEAVAPAKRRPLSACGRPSATQVYWGLAFFVTLFACMFVNRYFVLATPFRQMAPLVPLAAGAFYMRAFIRDLHTKKDELQLRIYLEAGAITVGGLLILMMTYPLLQKGGLVGPLDSTVVLVMIGLLAVAGCFKAARRYR
jgi:hypothetical protein